MVLVLLFVALIVSGFIGPILLGLASFPGVVIGGEKDLTPRWWLGLLLCTLAQSAVNLPWVAGVAFFTHQNAGMLGWFAWLAWVLGFFTANAPVAASCTQSATEEKERPELKTKPRTLALSVTAVVGFLCFLVFAFLPAAARWAMFWGMR